MAGEGIYPSDRGPGGDGGGTTVVTGPGSVGPEGLSRSRSFFRGESEL